MEIRANDTHYMQFPHNVAGLHRVDFTYYVFKNGVVRLDIPVELVEGPSSIYTFSFENDGEHESFWSLIAWQTSAATLKYGESWIVRDNAVRQAVLDIQADVKSGGTGGGVGGSVGTSIGRG